MIIDVKLPERARNLQRVGVLPSELHELHSRDFFQLVGSESEQKQRVHLVVVEKALARGSKATPAMAAPISRPRLLAGVGAGKLLMVF
jgi:hypothetical protein